MMRRFCTQKRELPEHSPDSLPPAFNVSPHSLSIQKDPSNPKLFTNRAMTRIKMQSWEACIDDCIKSFELEPGNMKGYYYLAQAQLALRHPNEALTSALTAYDECLKTNSSSTRNVSTLVLQAKKEKWEAKERERIRRRSDLLRELEDGLGKVAEYELKMLRLRIENGEVGKSEGAEERQEIESSSRQKIEELQNVFSISDPENLERRVTWLVSLHFLLPACSSVSTGSPRLHDRQHLFCHHA